MTNQTFSHLLAVAILATACLGTGANVSAQAAQGALDSAYAAQVPSSLRPLNIFNDGINTYIEPRKGQSLRIADAIESGPYLMIRGLPSEIRFGPSGQYSIVRVDAAGNPLAQKAAAAGTPAAPSIPLPVPAANPPVPPGPLLPVVPGPDRAGSSPGLAARATPEAARVNPEPPIPRALPSATAPRAALPAASKGPTKGSVRLAVATGEDLVQSLSRWGAAQGLQINFEVQAPLLARMASDRP